MDTKVCVVPVNTKMFTSVSLYCNCVFFRYLNIEDNLMSEVSQPSDDKIDLFELFETLWRGKWKIIVTTLIATLVGVAFTNVKANLYKVSTPIENGKPSVFIKSIPLNKLLENKALNSYVITAPSIFNMLIDEFNDYEIMENVVSKNEFVRQSIEDLNEGDKRKAVIKYAKSFKIIPPSKNEKNWMLSFKWHDNKEGSRLLSEALILTLIKVKTMLINNLDELATSVEINIQRELESLQQEISFISLESKEYNRKRILNLVEQSAIAKELGLELNNLDTNALAQTSSSGFLLNISSNEVPLYLRGFKALDKEISIIKSRSEEEQLLVASGYLVTKENIRRLKGDFSAFYIRNSIKLIETFNPNDFVQFDLRLADIKSPLKEKILYVGLSILVGGVLGALYVLISNSYRQRKAVLSGPQ